MNERRNSASLRRQSSMKYDFGNRSGQSDTNSGSSGVRVQKSENEAVRSGFSLASLRISAFMPVSPQMFPTVTRTSRRAKSLSAALKLAW